MTSSSLVAAAPPTPSAATHPASERRSRPPLGIAAGAGAAALLAIVVLTAPQPPGPGERWRWATIAVALGLCAWNVLRACRCYRDRGLTSVVGFLHVWAFFTFSFPAAEATYRYAVLRTGYYSIPTDGPVLLRAVGLLAVFQVVFFPALGAGFERGLGERLRGSRATGPDVRRALIFLLLLAPFVLARLLVLRQLGVRGAVNTAVTRVNYFEQLSGGVNPLVWLLNTLFPIFAVSLLCLGIKYLVPHPSATGRLLYIGALFACTGGVLLSGGRAELVYVLLTVLLFMYVSGYRSLRAFVPMLVPLVAVAALMFLLAQARTGGTNTLSQYAGDPYGSYDAYSSGDVSQLLGLGRFDAMTMIVDRHDGASDLGGKSYLYALGGGANITFLPRIALGQNFPIYHVGEAVMGYWVFGEAKSSALPSAPGELYLNFGPLGVVVGALVLGLLVRVVLALPSRLPGPAEFAVLLAVWTVARALSDESYIIATFVARNWFLLIALSVLALRRAPTVATGHLRRTEQQPIPEGVR